VEKTMQLTSKKNPLLAMLAILCAMALSGSPAWSAADHSHHHHGEPDLKAEVKRSMVDVNLAATPLVRQDGQAVKLNAEVGDGKPVVLAFMYTSCTTVCPVTSQILSEVQGLLGKGLEGVHIVSVSIDPQYDTPQRLAEYAKKWDAKPQWNHYTGTQTNSVLVQKAFGAYRGDKMNHLPLFFVQGGHKKNWVRLEGFPSAARVVSELREQASAQ
jgi:protein SCO1